MAPRGHFGLSVLHGCMTGSFNVFHHDPLEDFNEPSCSFRESTLVTFAPDERLCVCVSVVGFLGIRQQGGLTDCVWEVGGRNSRGLCATHTNAHIYKVHIQYNLGRWLNEWVVHPANTNTSFGLIINTTQFVLRGQRRVFLICISQTKNVSMLSEFPV